MSTNDQITPTMIKSMQESVLRNYNYTKEKRDLLNNSVDKKCMNCCNCNDCYDLYLLNYHTKWLNKLYVNLIKE